MTGGSITRDKINTTVTQERRKDMSNGKRDNNQKVTQGKEDSD